MSDTHEQIRIVQETVAGKEITFAHVIGGPAPIIYQKLGLNRSIDYTSNAIGIMNMTPPESAVIASDIAVKSGNVYLGFADRFTGTMIITGEIADVEWVPLDNAERSLTHENDKIVLRAAMKALRETMV